MRARKKDANHNEIAGDIQRAGFSFLDTSALGRGFPDGVAGRPGFAALVEIKNLDGKGDRLTPAEARVRALWTGPYVKATSSEDAITQLIALWRKWLKD